MLLSSCCLKQHLQLQQYSHGEVHGKVLTLTDIETQCAILRARTIAERKQLPGLEPGRADVILSGAMILQETMQLLDYERVTISDRGVRWGLVYEIVLGRSHTINLDASLRK